MMKRYHNPTPQPRSAESLIQSQRELASDQQRKKQRSESNTHGLNLEIMPNDWVKLVSKTENEIELNFYILPILLS